MHIGTRRTQSGKKNTNSTVLVHGGVGAQSVRCGLRSGAGTTPAAPYLARGLVKLAVLSLAVTVDSYSGVIECFKTRITRSAISGYASTIQGNLDKTAIAGRRAPTASKALSKPNFWLGASFFTSGFGSGAAVGLGFEFDGPPDSKGAAIASWLILAPAMRVSILSK